MPKRLGLLGVVLLGTSLLWTMACDSDDGGGGGAASGTDASVAADAQSNTGDDTVNSGSGVTYDEAGWDRVVPDDGAQWTYKWDDDDVTITFTKVDNTLGTPLSLFEGGNFDTEGPYTGVRYWVDLSEPWVGKVIRADYFHDDASLDTPAASYTYTPALTLNLAIEEGASSQSTYTSSLILAGDTENPYEDKEVQIITLEDKNATVEVPYGTITGCYHFTSALFMGEDPDLTGTPVVSGEFWFHPDLGPVKAGGEVAYELESIE